MQAKIRLIIRELGRVLRLNTYQKDPRDVALVESIAELIAKDHASRRVVMNRKEGFRPKNIHKIAKNENRKY
jgi:hypothetical protein